MKNIAIDIFEAENGFIVSTLPPGGVNPSCYISDRWVAKTAEELIDLLRDLIFEGGTKNE